ncbi:major capsid protein [Stutzerimonas nitrititolerans]|uniref:major capsid protein n=1 Tax=Stutzerimonas nitrititolerans TaxID=2482751 RepID=UPI00289BF629|nr:major capsid protein [Stutzerimonas nitrititolerans]
MKHFIKKVGVGAAVAMSVAAGSAYAAVGAEATAALAEAGTDVGTIGTAVLGVIIAAMAFKYIRRAL